VRKARVLVALGIASIAIGRSSLAGAQVIPKGDTDPSAVPLMLRAQETARTRLELYDPNQRPPHDLPAAVCFDRCELTAVPGRYLLRVSGPPGSGVHTSKRHFDLRDGSVVTIDPPSSFGRYSGLALGVAGPVLLLGGLFLAVNSTSLTGERDQPYYALGIGSIVTGVVATPVGWIMFGENGRPEIDVQPSRSRKGVSRHVQTNRIRAKSRQRP
jgi:hypothetical protein